MVRRGVMRSIELAACCRVEVVKGGEGRRTVSFSSTRRTRQGRVVIASRAMAVAAVSSSTTTFRVSRGLPVLVSKFFAVATDLPPVSTSSAVNSPPPESSRGWRDARAPQYSEDRNFCRSSSRSTSRRRAALWTRPALSLPRTFFQSTGESE